MFFNKIDKRIRISLLIMLFLFVLVFLKVCKIQIFDYSRLKTLADDLWSRNLEIKAERGRILDRNGIVLADNETTVSLVLVPNQIKNKNKTTISLANILGISKEKMDKHVLKKTSIERVHPEGRRVDSKRAGAINSLKIDGVYLVKESKRYYPYNNLLSHVLGYVGIDNQGLGGIEAKYDDYLTGVSGAIKYFSDAKGNKLNLSNIYVEPVRGMDIELTINLRIQQSIERELNNIVDMFSPDMALAVVMNPKTGEVLAMGSRPDFDSNNYSKYSIEALNRNLPIFASYEPGSTFKIMTMATAVNEGVVNLDKDMFYDSGRVNVDGAIIKCWKAGGHGEQTFLQVLQNTCNLVAQREIPINAQKVLKIKDFQIM